jgi:hypothetical protein
MVGKNCYRPGIDISEKKEWADAYAWLKQEAELFHKTFSPRIKALVIPDEEEETELHGDDVEESS